MLIFHFLINICYCTIIGIDLGSDSIKVAVGSKVKPVHLVRDYYNKEGTPNIFAFRDYYNWAFGEGAIDQCRLDPKSCIQNQKIPLDDKFYFSDNSLKGYQIAALSLIQVIKNVQNSENITDDIKVVIAIPPSMTSKEKSYLYCALVIAEINCIQFITSTYSPIETYVNEKIYGSTPVNSAVFIDIGHSGVRVSGFEFNNKQIVQRFGEYNDNIGGKTIDNSLFEMIIKKYNFKLSPNNDIEYQKNRFMLLAKIRKAREELSSCNATWFNFKNKNITISRDDLDNCCAEIKQALSQMLQSFKTNNGNLLVSGSIQLLGGCSKIICLQQHIQKLFPNITILKTMDVMSSVCKGACYIATDEIPSDIRDHESSVTSEIIFKAGGNAYKLFSRGNTKRSRPTLSINNVNPNQIFKVIDKNDNQEFLKFSIDIPKNNQNFYSNKVDIIFYLNNYLMPVPNQPEMIENGKKTTISVDFKTIGWEVSTDELGKAKPAVYFMSKSINQKLKIEIQSKSIEEYYTYIQSLLQKSYGSFNWRNAIISSIRLMINSKLETCLRENDYECPKEKEKQILQDFKSLVKTKLQMDDL